MQPVPLSVAQLLEHVRVTLFLRGLAREPLSLDDVREAYGRSHAAIVENFPSPAAAAPSGRHNARRAVARPSPF